MATLALTGLNNSALGAALSRLSPNERRLLGVLALMVVPALLYFAWDFSYKAHVENREAREVLESARQAQRRASGAGLADEIVKTRNEVRDWSWRAGSVQVAQVMAQDDLAEFTRFAAMTGAEVQTRPRLETAGEVSLAPMQVTGPFSWSALSGFMQGLGGSVKGFVLDRVQETDDAEPQLRIELRVPLVATEAAP